MPTQEEDKRAVSMLLNWFRQLAVHGSVPEADYESLDKEYHSIGEVREMLIEALEKEREQLRQEGFQQGIEQGIEQGAAKMIQQILQQRLGVLPPAIRDRLEACTIEQLNRLANPALDAATWAEFEAALPEQTE